jgi:hypothetical protein
MKIGLEESQFFELNSISFSTAVSDLAVLVEN